jgi:hypothetical protein
MTGNVRFEALVFDLVDGRLAEGQLVACGSPALAIQTAQGQWKIFGHAGAVASAAPAISMPINRFKGTCCAGLGQLPDEYLRDDTAE